MRSPLGKSFNDPASRDKACLVSTKKSFVQELRGQYLKLLIGISVVSLSCLALVSNSPQKSNKTNSRQFSNSNNVITKPLLNSHNPQNKPFSLANNRPLEATLQIIKNLTFVQCRIVSSDYNGWVIDDNNLGLPSNSSLILIKNFDMLNGESAIVLDEFINNHCPIRPRSSNGPPILA